MIELALGSAVTATSGGIGPSTAAATTTPGPIAVVRATLVTLGLAVLTGGLAGLVTVATVRGVTGHTLFESRGRSVGTGTVLGGSLVVSYVVVAAVDGTSGPLGDIDPGTGMALGAVVVAVVGTLFVLVGRRSADGADAGLSDVGVGVLVYGFTYGFVLVVLSPLLSSAVAGLSAVV